MPEQGFKQVQYAFTAHLRDPDRNPPPPGLAKRRTDLYCELAFTNIRNFVSDNFPVLRKLYDEEHWAALVRDYFSRHRSRTPLFTRLATEFLDYLAEERSDPGGPPFLWELAHYEWMESALRMDLREISFEGIDRDGDLLAGRPALSPLAWPLAYRFPVHRISPKYRPSESPAQPTYLVIYRDEKDEVGFMELNAVSARLIELLGKQPEKTGRELMVQISQELNHPNPDVVVKGGHDTLRQWRDRRVVLGTRRSPVT
ncbi:MAG: HvfC family RiPP maturation protein [Chromatiales bacterium]